jgi:hypothetical protein
MLYALQVFLAKTLKILLRKEVNRKSLGRLGVQLLVTALQRQAQPASRTLAAPELGNVVINTCYNGDANVRTFVECNGLPPLLLLLRSSEVAIVQSVLGALQGVCFVPLGRQHIRDSDIEVSESLNQSLSQSVSKSDRMCDDCICQQRL